MLNFTLTSDVLCLEPEACLCCVSLPYDAMGWSSVCECATSWSYSLFYKIFGNTVI